MQDLSHIQLRSIVLLEKNTLQSWGTLSEQKEASFLPGQLCTWLDLCVLHKDKSARFQPC